LTEVLGDEVMAAALIDRILHHCHWSISAATAIDCAVARNGQAMAKSPTVVSESDHRLFAV
jgi:hypothetical protein